MTPKKLPQTIEHLNRQIPPEAHTAMYNFHKYWSRKTWNVVGKFIENYCPKDGVVFDPFGGSGVTGLEALKIGRRVIISDLSPISTEIIRLTIKNVSLVKLEEAFRNVEKKVKKKINDLYVTNCRKCLKEIVFDCAIWKDGKPVSIRYANCPHCGTKRVGNNPLTTKDKDLLTKIKTHKIKEWYPTNKLYHANGNPFKEKQKFESLDELHTKRNLYALAILMDAIEKEPNKDLRDFLKIGFTSIVHLCTSMTPVRPTRPLSSAWTQHSYWSANEFMEQNVWNKFESGIIGKQGLLKAKAESNKYYEKIKFGKTFQDVINKKADVFIYTGSCIDLMKKMNKHDIRGCVDYIFTDPPYDAAVQYGELSYMWVAWLKKDKNYIENMDANEIINNEKQKKDFDTYTSLLRNSFTGMFDVLKPNKYLTLTFHSPTFKVRNSTIRMGVLSGFELEKIHHQELAHASPKSLLQPFGSAQGDFYLRFHKAVLAKGNSYTEKIDELRFEKTVVDTAIKILAERGEPTPYTILINAIDPALAKNGFYAETDTGLDVETVLRSHTNKVFDLVRGRIGSTEGKLWWFKNPNQVSHLKTVPLTERVEQTVLRELQSKGKVSFTDIWEAVSIAFPNSLTSDQSNIKNALEDYARPVIGGDWVIKPSFKYGFVEKEHTTVMALLAEIGAKLGYQIHIGKIEQTHEIDTPLLKKKGRLDQYMDYKNIKNLKEIMNIDVVEDIDLLWIKDNKIEYVFEVESTTSMISALQRASNIDSKVKKIMLIPADRENQFNRKMKTPMFDEQFKKDNWGVVLFDVLYSKWNKDKTKIKISDLVGVSSTIKKVSSNKIYDENQLNIFD